ncbi:MAG: hypothetical protein P8020_15635 [Acidobacteriota bacterium]|jgi:hypothetical protein
MLRRAALFCMVVCVVGTMAFAQEGKTWQTQEKVWDVTTIKVFPNAGEQYLNNLKRTWATAMSRAKQQGLIGDYKILSSVTDNGGDYNLMLIIEYPNLAALDANKENLSKWMKFDDEMKSVVPKEESDKITSSIYPKVREIKGETLMREIRFLP